MKFYISTIPFGSTNKAPIEAISKEGHSFEINSLGRKITEEELIKKLHDIDVLVAGTEPITKKVLESAKNLKIISRVGIGIDNIDLDQAKKQNIKIFNTPEGPSMAVAQYTLGLMLSMTRHIHLSARELSKGVWDKKMGHGFESLSFGLIGFGRIGKKVSRLLKAFNPKEILFYDPFDKGEDEVSAKKVDFDFLLQKADIVSLHLPLESNTKGLISSKEIKKMKKNAIIINTSRGGIIDEKDLHKALSNKMIGGAALDVFENEPYEGPLSTLDNCLLTPHSAPMTTTSRENMEYTAVKQAIDQLKRL
tara:strand:+ start:357 stop:1277 length:921 start_codon:yes stop_codon:yes gene_type:complete